MDCNSQQSTMKCTTHSTHIIHLPPDKYLASKWGRIYKNLEQKLKNILKHLSSSLGFSLGHPNQGAQVCPGVPRVPTCAEKGSLPLTGQLGTSLVWGGRAHCLGAPHSSISLPACRATSTTQFMTRKGLGNASEKNPPRHNKYQPFF